MIINSYAFSTPLNHYEVSTGNEGGNPYKPKIDHEWVYNITALFRVLIKVRPHRKTKAVNNPPSKIGSSNWNRNARGRPLSSIQVPYEFCDVRSIGLIEHQQGIPSRSIWQRRHGQMRSRETFLASDVEFLLRSNGRFLRCPRDVEATDT